MRSLTPALALLLACGVLVGCAGNPSPAGPSGSSPSSSGAGASGSSGSSSSSASGSSSSPNPMEPTLAKKRGLAETVTFDPRDVPLRCMVRKRLRARKQAPNRIAIGSGPAAPRIEFTVNASGAEADSLSGAAEGAEQLGRALLYPNAAPDALLTQLETCLRG